MIKRFYKEVSIEKDESSDAFKVLCDGKPLKNMKGNVILIPSETLAQEVAAEWQAQDEEIIFATMPITNFVSMALGMDDDDRKRIKEDSMSFVSTDVLCYRASFPANLVQKQKETWDPIIDWLKDALEVEMAVAEGVLPCPQTLKTEEKIREVLNELNDFQLLGFVKIAAVCTSVSLGLAVVKNFITAEDAFERSRLEETYQNNQWGRDIESLKARKLALAEATNAEKALKLSGYL
ncbi:MAG: hypothetical protein IKD08_01745 [Alphaproteobacteria bacterium]|nr:hypothetical protein [Alphaproteobacteria bacterium]